MHRLRAVALDDHCWGVTQTASPISSGVGGFPDDAVASEDPARDCITIWVISIWFVWIE